MSGAPRKVRIVSRSSGLAEDDEARRSLDACFADADSEQPDNTAAILINEMLDRALVNTYVRILALQSAVREQRAVLECPPAPARPARRTRRRPTGNAVRRLFQ